MAEIEPTEAEELEPVEIETDEQEEGEPAEQAQAEDEFSIEIEGEDTSEEPPLVKTLREQIRDRDRELAQHRKAAAPQIVVGEKPTLENCEYDEDLFDREYEAWQQRKAAAENQEAELRQQAEVKNQQWLRTVQNYQVKAAALPVKDFAAAEEALTTALPQILQSALLMYATDPAKVGYALYKHPAKLAQLAQELDPIRFVIAIKDMERNLKVVNRAKPPAPEAETIQRGSASMSGNLSKEADKALASGDIDTFRKLRKQAA